MSNLTDFFWPKSIAIVGASDNPDTIRGRILEYLVQRGYTGHIYLVSPSHKIIGGRPTFSSIRDIPGPIDLALLAVPADASAMVLEDCEAAGVKFAVVFSSGFADQGRLGIELQRRIEGFSRSGSLRICGPNTSGYFNVQGMIPATFARSVDGSGSIEELGRLESGPVGIVAQSAGLGFGQQHRCAVQHGLGFSYIVSTGNEVDLEALDFVEYVIEDVQTRVVLLLIEGLKNGKRLRDVARRALELGKPIVVAKFGRTEAGSRAAISHAARIIGLDAGYSSVFRRYGLIRVEDEEEMSDLAAAICRCPLPTGNRVAIITTSGGAGVWMADACELAGLEVPVLDEITQAALAPFVPSFGSILNPVDITAQVTLNSAVADDASRVFPKILDILAKCAAVDALILVANLSDGKFLVRERASFLIRSDKPLMLYTHTLAPRATLELMWTMGLVCFGSTRRTARTLKHLVDYAEFRRREGDVESTPATPEITVALPDVASLRAGLCEYQAKALLSRYLIPVTREKLARTASEAVEIAAHMGGAVALKIQSPDIPHKSDLGGVVLRVQGEREIRAAFAEVISVVSARERNAIIHGVLVQEMVPPGRELALGISRDKDFGPLLMVALGGIHVEVHKDAVFEPLPVRRGSAIAMLRRLRSWSLLEGTRGEGRADLEALADLMAHLSMLVESTGDAVREIDLNPVFVYAQDKGVVVVDALIVGNRPGDDRV